MPRANRHFLPGYVWHLTHRCHHQAFLLKFARDRRRYLHWLFEAKKRFGLSVLNYRGQHCARLRRTFGQQRDRSLASRASVWYLQCRSLQESAP